MWRKVFAVVLLLFVLLAGATLFGAEKLAVAVVIPGLEAAGFTISYKNFELSLLEGKLALDGFSLAQTEGGRPLVSIEQANLEIVPIELVFGSNDRGTLTANGIDIPRHLGEGSSTEEKMDSGWKPGSWLAYRRLLPGTSSLEEVNLYWREDDPDGVTHISSLQLLPGKIDQQTLLRVAANHRDADIELNGSLDMVEGRGDRPGGMGLAAHLVSNRYQTKVSFDGSLQGTADDLSYHLNTQASSENINGPLRHFNSDFDLNGKTSISGRLEGNLEGFRLEAKSVILNNMPEYQFSGGGLLEYSFNGDSKIDLAMTGELTNLAPLITWIDIDITALGSAQASVKLQGSLNELVLRDMVVTTRNQDDLEISLKGNLHINNLTDDRLGDEDGVNVVVTAPSLAALQTWTGDLGIETGPLRLSARILDTGTPLELSNISLAATGNTGVKVSLSGKIADARSLLQGDVAGAGGIELQANISSPSTRPLTDLAGLELRELGALTASARISGTGANLQLSALGASTGKDGVQLGVNQGSMQLSLAPEFGYGNIQMPTTLSMDSTARLSEWADWHFADMGELHAQATVQQSAKGFSLADLSLQIREENLSVASIKGNLAQLSPLSGVNVTGELNGLPTRQALENISGAVQDDLDLGKLFGSFQLSSVGNKIQLQHVNIENRGSQQVKLLVKGKIAGTRAGVDIDLDLDAEIPDRQLLQDLTGLQMGALDSSLKLSGSAAKVSVSGNTRFGETDLVSRLILSIGEAGITDIKGSVTSPKMRLQDLGLAQIIPEGVEAEPEPKVPEQNDTQTSERQVKPLPLESLPDFPIDVILATLQLEGTQFTAENFSLHARTGDGRYEIADLVLNYTGGAVQVNAKLDTRPDLPQWSINARLHDFHIERLRDLGAPDNITGNANSVLHLETSGHNTGQMLQQLDGEVAIAFEDINLKGAAYDRLAVDTLAWFFTGGVLEEETRFSCVMGKFDIDKGLAASEFIYVESEYLTAEGTASMNLPAGTVDVSITPRSKQRRFQIPGTIRVKGPIEDLNVGTSPISSTMDTSAQFIFLAPSMAMRAFDRTVDLFGSTNKDKKNEKEPVRKCPQVEFKKAAP
jgi:hypothetical protein